MIITLLKYFKNERLVNTPEISLLIIFTIYTKERYMFQEFRRQQYE